MRQRTADRVVGDGPGTRTPDGIGDYEDPHDSRRASEAEGGLGRLRGEGGKEPREYLRAISSGPNSSEDALTDRSIDQRSRGLPSGPRTMRDHVSVQQGRAFNEWLRTQLKAKKMSQRQLAQQSGVDHSTISRLVRGDRTPSLGTATKLARGLRELHDEADTPQYFGVVASSTSHPTARVEYALRADDALGEPQVRQIMEYYLAVRMRRLNTRPAALAEQVRRLAPVPARATNRN